MDKVKMYTLLLFAVCAFCLAGAAAARAEDFTFTVPVHLKALDASIKFVTVKCSLDSGIMGTSAILYPDANGNLDQNFVVKFNAPPDPSKAKKYDCGIILYYDGGNCDFRQGQQPQGAGCATKGSFTGSVAGTIPSQ